MKDKTCKQCGELFTPQRPLQAVCNAACAYLLTLEKKRQKAIEERVKPYRKAKPTRKASPAELAQRAFNRFIRLRDSGKPCISCGHPDDGSRQRHASHFRTVGGNPELRFNEHNCHASCSICNNHMSGNLTPYEDALRKKIGDDMVDWLKGPHERAAYREEDFNQIKEEYNRKANELQKLLS